ncbi:hypothetical protein [Streptomyces aureoverticillatus]|uniref:hypothetical protein n=1 Tax=Streptomyces aureoverticillatus TaxID=66871 RepID=UPI0013DB1FAF|nr:hypothetical protein [Streptomyces aureoverticillatus]QIB45717.1 hypothetical protein G3H79_24220 [Streptomyces aureoverticillatus]
MRVSKAGLACGSALLGAVLTLTLAGCQLPGGSGRAGPESGTTPAGSAASSGAGAVFLGAGECSSWGREFFTEVPCGSERAAARVIARHGGRSGDGPLCPARSDFILHVSVPRGYACMRNLEAPHPGDPGAGGGPRTVVGDCVYGVGRGEVRETACDGSGRRGPEYRVTASAAERALCPAGTDLYVALGGARAVGCAVRV